MSRRYDDFRNVLRELFQLDQADLDFGIYRIMAVKRAEIERFLDQDLLPQVRQSLSKYQPASKAELEQNLEDMTRNLRAAGINPDDAPKVKELRESLAKATDLDALEDEIFSHLVTFFRRYYKEGDFISQRRYKEDAYAIPYNGEEVKLYWANHDQYYVKSADYLTSYAFRTGDGTGPRVRFEMVAAETERDNNKPAPDKERRFILHEADPVAVERDSTHPAEETLVIRFEYRPDGENRKQDKINDATEAAVLKAAPANWQARLAAKAPTEANPQRTLLAKHLDGFTKRNTFDFFIHKDLGKFLRRELDFFIKNEIVYLDDLVDVNDAVVKQQLSKAIVLREIAHKIIDFLAQVENFQKKLWLKKKFVVETSYCITLDRVPQEIYAEIAANDRQREEWVRLFAIDEIAGYSTPLTEDFLVTNPNLVVDTRLFDGDFTEPLLESLSDIDATCDGLLIHSDNFQALNLLQERYREEVKCVHIDPPYNTTTSGFLYRNEYEHSSWLCMIDNRIGISLGLMSDDGSFLCHIDENEYERLHFVCENYPIANAGTLVWDKRNPMNGGRGLATQHEYVVWRTKQQGPINLRNKTILSMLAKAAELVHKAGGVSDTVKSSFAAWVNGNNALSGGEKAYRYMDEEGCIYQSVSLRAPEPRDDPKFHQPLIHPVTGKPCPVPPNGFSRTPDTLQGMMDRGEILFGVDETTQPRQKYFLTEESRRQISSVMQDARKGRADTAPLGLEFPYCHPVSLYEELVGSVVHGKVDTTLDFFAGSGTTGHAVINLNREDGGNRKYILVEMGEYFETVTKPRILKVVYSPDWSDGKPTTRDQGISQLIKVLRLESYEDTLDNLEFTRPGAQQRLLDEGNRDDPFREAYLLHYMLELESRESPSLLNIQAFANPFDYRLKVTRNHEQQTVAVDLVETFNYLIGLRVKTLAAQQHLAAEFERDAHGRLAVKSTRTCKAGEGWSFRRVEGETPQGQKALILWRTLSGDPEKDNALLDHYFERMAYSTRDLEFDVIYVNGDNNLENLRRDDETWKVRLIEADFHRLMFDVQDV